MTIVLPSLLFVVFFVAMDGVGHGCSNAATTVLFILGMPTTGLLSLAKAPTSWFLPGILIQYALVGFFLDRRIVHSLRDSHGGNP